MTDHRPTKASERASYIMLMVGGVLICTSILLLTVALVIHFSIALH